MLKGEGVTVGKFFELVTWRREGLIARIRMRAFNVRTLEDRVATLRSIKPVDLPGAESVRLLPHPKERVATFDREQLQWRDLPAVDHQGKPAVRLPLNVAARRRKGRGPSDYYITTPGSNGQVNFLPIKEATVLLHAYSQIAQQQPVILSYTRADEIFTIPRGKIVLPQPHQEVLEMLSLEKSEPWNIPAAVFELAEAVFAKLGIELRPQR